METPDNLFTPRTANGSRLRLQLSPEDFRKIDRGRAWSATVTDLNTGKRYAARAASCGQPHCFCDATAKELKCT